MPQFTISADYIPAPLLRHQIQRGLPDIDLQLKIEGPEYRSGGPFSDPQVLSATVTAGGHILAALIAAFALIYSARKKENKSGPSTVINIYAGQKGDSEPTLRVYPEALEGKSPEEVALELPDLESLEDKIWAMTYLDDE